MKNCSGGGACPTGVPRALRQKGSGPMGKARHGGGRKAEQKKKPGGEGYGVRKSSLPKRFRWADLGAKRKDDKRGKKKKRGQGRVSLLGALSPKKRDSLWGQEKKKNSGL